jgi:anaerobic dimethyl sulfoxide reductase subunit B (iron-sulfur subunit)
MAMNGLLIDYEYCTGCHACEMACKAEKGLTPDQWGIKLALNGPWKLEDDKWEYNYIPIPTTRCDLCASTVAAGKPPACVHHCQSLVIDYGPVEELAKKMTKRQMVLYTPIDA